MSLLKSWLRGCDVGESAQREADGSLKDPWHVAVQELARRGETRATSFNWLDKGTKLHCMASRTQHRGALVHRHARSTDFAHSH